MHDRERHPLEQAIGRALDRVEPIPHDLPDLAKSFGAFIDLDASLATLLDQEAMAIRDPDQSQFAFEWPDGLVLTIQSRATNGSIQVTGVFAPSQVDAAWVEMSSGAVAEVGLAEGTFEVEVERAPYRVRAEQSGQVRVTPWTHH